MSVHHERILSGVLEALELGCPIVTADGEQIGTLSEVAEEAIKVDAPMRRDFWIDVEYVRACEGGRIELSFLKQDLGAYKTATYRSGDAAQADDPVAEGKADHIISDAEQMETRTFRSLHRSMMPRIESRYFCLCSSSACTPQPMSLIPNATNSAVAPRSNTPLSRRASPPAIVSPP